MSSSSQSSPVFGEVQTKPHRLESAPQVRARIAGILYFMLLPFALIYVPSVLIVRGNAAATAQNVIASETLFRLGIVASLIAAIINLLVDLALYQLLKVVHKTMAWLMVIFVIVGVPIVMLNELNQLAVPLILSNADYLQEFTTGQLQALGLLLLNIYKQGLNIAQIFWGLWLFPMGYLVFKSGFLPKILGVLLIIGCFGYVIQSIAAFLALDFRVNLIFYTSWGELLLPLWLLIKGVNVELYEKRAAEVA
jgi:hypothetical protein